jgi:hypothetical protein
MASLSPWLVLAGLGGFHGLNPAMGWLFAVGLGLHRKSRKIVLLSLIPIAIGHTVSIVVVAIAVVTLGLVVDQRLLEMAAGTVLIGWAVYHVAYGHRHRVRIGMQTGMVGLGFWSLLVATAHGAGLMLVPVLAHHSGAPVPASLGGAAVASVLHAAAMLVTAGVVALAVLEILGLGVLRRAWVNVDKVWAVALIGAGAATALTH